MDDFEHLPLYLSGSGRTSQEIAISGSCQQILLGICNSLWHCWLHKGCIPMWGSLWMAFPSVSAPHLVPYMFYHECLFPLLRRIEVSKLLSSFFFSFMWSMNCIWDILSFWANIHLSVSTYHVCSFVTELPHSELLTLEYFLDPSICLLISWSHCF